MTTAPLGAAAPSRVRLVPHWRAIIRRAWSIRLLILAGGLSGAEAALPMLGIDALPPGPLAALSALVAAAAFVARILAQKELTDE